MHLLSYLRRRLVCVAQFYFDASDEGTVYPVFGGGAAGLADDSGQVVMRARSIQSLAVVPLVCRMTVLR